jgi:hypothetical protein
MPNATWLIKYRRWRGHWHLAKPTTHTIQQYNSKIGMCIQYRYSKQNSNSINKMHLYVYAQTISHIEKPQ